MAIYIKNAEELLIMREAGRIVARAHEAMREAIRPGVSTAELDRIAAAVFEQHDARPAFLGYPQGAEYPFPASITASINTELVHGIPSEARILQEGDIISLDTGCHYQGFVGDAAYTYGVGTISPEAERLLKVTEEALYVGIAASQAGRETKDIASTIQKFVEGHGYSVIREYSGHGVGREMHEEPSIPNWWPTRRQMLRMRPRQEWKSARLKRGMTFALEPMVSIGKPATRECDDHWTVVMEDGALSAHFEHTIAIVEDEPLILTLP